MHGNTPGYSLGDIGVYSTDSH